MGFLARAVAESKTDTVYERWLQLLNLGHKSKAGPSVNLQSALRVSAAFACISRISKGIAAVPFRLYQSTEKNGLETILPARKHALYDIVTARPNGWQTSFEFRETLGLHACLGNAYAYKNIFRGKIIELILLDPGRVKAEQGDDWEPVYTVTGKDGSVRQISKDLIWHVRGMSWDGFLGLDVLNLAREALGLSIAAEQTHAELHANSMQFGGVYSVEGNLSTDQNEKLTAWLKKQAAAGAGAPLVLDRGAKWLSQSMSGLDAQHLEMRNHEIAEVCRFFDMLPLMIGHTGDKASTFASAEQMFIAHVVHCLMPWYKRISESADVNLLTDADRRDGYYHKFIPAGLLAGTHKDRAEYFSRALGNGGAPAWMTQDEVRTLEELNPFGGEAAMLPARLGAGPVPAND